MEYVKSIAEITTQATTEKIYRAPEVQTLGFVPEGLPKYSGKEVIRLPDAHGDWGIALVNPGASIFKVNTDAGLRAVNAYRETIGLSSLDHEISNSIYLLIEPPEELNSNPNRVKIIDVTGKNVENAVYPSHPHKETGKLVQILVDDKKSGDYITFSGDDFKPESTDVTVGDITINGEVYPDVKMRTHDGVMIYVGVDGAGPVAINGKYNRLNSQKVHDITQGMISDIGVSLKNRAGAPYLDEVTYRFLSAAVPNEFLSENRLRAILNHPVEISDKYSNSLDGLLEETSKTAPPSEKFWAEEIEKKLAGLKARRVRERLEPAQRKLAPDKSALPVEKYPIHMNIKTDDQEDLYVVILQTRREQRELFAAMAREQAEETQEQVTLTWKEMARTATTEDIEAYLDRQREAAEIAAERKRVSKEKIPGAHLGKPVQITNIPSTEGPFFSFPEVTVEYPPVVIEALGELYTEFNESFRSLVEANAEWDTDYRYCISDDGTPINGWVQIDMNGLTPDFLAELSTMGKDEVREILRRNIFEIENSIAMYGLLSGIAAKDGQDSTFKTQFRESLNVLRNKHDMKIAILAVTEQKYQAMRESEFGKIDEEILTDKEVQEISGFDRLFGPEEFKQYIRECDEESKECEYLLYVRSSDPLTKLKDPSAPIEIPLLENDNLRRVIKELSLTFNIDNPRWNQKAYVGRQIISDPTWWTSDGNNNKLELRAFLAETEDDYRKLINDTKKYLKTMNMAFEIRSLHDLLSAGYVQHLESGDSVNEYDGDMYSQAFSNYLEFLETDPEHIQLGDLMLRAKPGGGTYGCYGHLRGFVTNIRFLRDLENELQERGSYVLQPEIRTPTVVNLDEKPKEVLNRTTGEMEKIQIAYTYIDRNWFAMVDGKPVFTGGFRFYMPLDSVEAQKGRIHGNDHAVLEEIKTSG